MIFLEINKAHCAESLCLVQWCGRPRCWLGPQSHCQTVVPTLILRQILGVDDSDHCAVGRLRKHYSTAMVNYRFTPSRLRRKIDFVYKEINVRTIWNIFVDVSVLSGSKFTYSLLNRARARARVCLCVT